MPKTNTRRARAPRANTNDQREQADALTAERLSTIPSDPAVGEQTKRRLRALVADLNAVVGPDFPRTPEVLALTFAESARLTRERPRAVGADAAAALCEQITTLAERVEPQEYKLARRLYELMRQENEEGGHEVIEWFDELVGVLDWSQAPEVGIPQFVARAREARNIRPLKKWTKANITRQVTRRAYDYLREIVARVDVGESLQSITEDREKHLKETGARVRREERAKPEPKDKTSDEWRIWKLRRMEHALSGAGGEEAERAAWVEFRALLTDLLEDEDSWDAALAASLLPRIIIARQQRQRPAKKGGK